MQFLKTLMLATVVLGTSALPSFASEEFSLGGNDAAVSSEVDMSRDRGRDWDRDHRRPRPRFFTCFARNVTGRTFVGRDWNPRRAQREALRNCRSRSFGPIGFSCRVVGCRR